MFLTSKRSYTRDGQQTARGRFLILFSHNQYKWEEQNNTPHYELHGQSFDVVTGNGFVIKHQCQCAGSAPFSYTEAMEVPYYYLHHCLVHAGEYKRMPSDMTRKLYAHVCYVSMKQLGHFMMGYARTLKVHGKSWTNLCLSGTYGSDGLPCDYEDLTPDSQKKLVLVPPDLAEKFWKGGGHNSAGDEASAMFDWALATFKVKATMPARFGR